VNIVDNSNSINNLLNNVKNEYKNKGIFFKYYNIFLYIYFDIDKYIFFFLTIIIILIFIIFFFFFKKIKNYITKIIYLL